MKNRSIILLLAVLATLVIVVIIWDFMSKRPDRSSQNPWEYNVDEFKKLDDSLLIKYNETRRIKLDSTLLHGIAFHNNKIYILSDEYLQVISPEGTEYIRKKLMDSPRCITVSDNHLYIGYMDHIASYDLDGNLEATWDTLGPKAVLTSLAVMDDLLFAADAGNRRILRYKINGELLGQFEGKSESGQLHGFIIPSPSFDLAVNQFGELWVVNPGKHALEHYSYDGRLLGYWDNASFDIEGFSGCCNPAQIAILADGSFVTAEKGMVRIKVHKASGELIAVVAPTEKFKEAFNAPDLALSPDGVVYALDIDSRMIRVFQHN